MAASLFAALDAVCGEGDALTLFRNRVLGVAGIYALCGLLWIVLSDRLLLAFAPGLGAYALFGTVKGVGFVLLTSLLLYVLLRGYWRIEAESAMYGWLSRYANDIILLADLLDGRIVHVNDRALEAYGLDRRSLSGMRLSEIRALGTRARFSEDMRRVQEKGAHMFETVHVRADGAEFPVEVNARSVTIRKRRYYQAVVRDISERKRAEERILKLNRVRALVSQVNQAIVREREEQALFDRVCRIAVEEGGFVMAWIGLIDPLSGEVRPRARAGPAGDYLEKAHIVLGNDSRGRGPTGRALMEGVPAVCNDIREDPCMDPWRADALRLGYRSSAAFPLIVSGRPSGAFNLYSGETDFFRDEEEVGLLVELAGNISFAMEFMQQEVLRQSADLGLRESEARYRSLFENMLDGLAYCRVIFEEGVPADLLYLEVNGAFERLTGLKDVVGKKATEVLPGFRETNAEAMERFGRVARGGRPERFELYVEQIDAWLAISAYSPEQGYFVAVFDNITERKRGEQELLRHRDHLEELVRARTSELEGKVAEIERMNRVFVGRELKMAELKEKTRDLERKTPGMG